MTHTDPTFPRVGTMVSAMRTPAHGAGWGRRTRLSACLIALTTALTLAACNGDEPEDEPTEPEPTATEEPEPEPTTEEPEDEPTLSEDEQHIEDAQQAYLERSEALDESAHAGHQDEELFNEVIASSHSMYLPTLLTLQQNYAEYNLTEEGRREVVSMEGSEFSETEGEVMNVSFNACLDLSDTSTLRDGEPQEVPEPRGRSLVAVVMTYEYEGYQGRESDSGWLLLQSDPQDEESC